MHNYCRQRVRPGSKEDVVTSSPAELVPCLLHLLLQTSLVSEHNSTPPNQAKDSTADDSVNNTGCRTVETAAKQVQEESVHSLKVDEGRTVQFQETASSPKYHTGLLIEQYAMD